MNTNLTVPRSAWARALTAHPPERVKALASELAAGYKVLITSLPQAGLGQLTLLDGAFHDPYYLGEFPLSTCSVEIMLPDGRVCPGATQVMADDADLAYALAVLDAVLAAKLPGAEQVASLVESGLDSRRQEEEQRRLLLAATRVDFALLNAIGGEAADG